MNPSDVKVTAFYPIKIKDVPMVTVTIGQLVLSDVARRDPSMPYLADVYADFPLTGGAAGSLGPRAVIGVKVDDKSGRLGAGVLPAPRRARLDGAAQRRAPAVGC